MRLVGIALCAASLTVAACSKKEASNEAWGGYADSNVVATIDSSHPVVVRAAGIRFDPPSAWPHDRYRVDVRAGKEAAAEQPRAAHWVQIVYLSGESAQDESALCRLIVFPRDAWNQIEEEAGPPVGTLLESLDEWVYVAQLPQSNPYRPGSPEAAQFEAMRLSIREVRARFSIEGDGPTLGPDEL